MSAFVSPLVAIARALHRLPVAVPFLGKAHEASDHTAVITDRSLTLTCRNSPCCLSCECCIGCSRSTERGCHVAPGICVNWNVLQYLDCATASHTGVAMRLLYEWVLESTLNLLALNKSRQTRNAINQPQSHPIPKFYIFQWDGTEAG